MTKLIRANPVIGRDKPKLWLNRNPIYPLDYVRNSSSICLVRGLASGRALLGFSGKRLDVGMSEACFVGSLGLHFMEDMLGLVCLILEAKRVFPLRMLLIKPGQGIEPVASTYFQSILWMMIESHMNIRNYR